VSLDIPHKIRVAIRLRSQAVCERCMVRTATDMAHRMPRASGGHSTVNIAHLCRTCHQWCHANPKQARLQGWIIAAHRKIKPSDVAAIPMLRTGDTYIVFSEHTDHRGALVTVTSEIPITLAFELFDQFGISEAVNA
jgi:hypothetical protein